MSITDPNRTRVTHESTPDPTTSRPARRIEASRSRMWRETKPSPKTTELWLTLGGVAVLAIIYNASRDASLDLFRACMLGTVIAAAYIVSRGLAKAGSHDDDNQLDRQFDRS
jgi:hypothetical protein